MKFSKLIQPYPQVYLPAFTIEAIDDLSERMQQLDGRSLYIDESGTKRIIKSRMDRYGIKEWSDRHPAEPTPVYGRFYAQMGLQGESLAYFIHDNKQEFTPIRVSDFDGLKPTIRYINGIDGSDLKDYIHNLRRLNEQYTENL